jgi:hypothetical protein
MKRESRERNRPASEPAGDDLDPRSVAAPARRPVPQPAPSSWMERNWVSVVGLSVGLLVSLWRFGLPHMNDSSARGGAFPSAEFHWHGALAAGHQVQIRGMNGAVHAVAADGTELEVTALKRSREVNPRDIPIAVIQRGGDVTVCAAAAGPAAPNECAEGENLGRGGALNIEYTVHVPKGVLFTAHTVNGGITVDGLAAAVELQTVNGAIEVSTSGTAKAETVNGSIRASVGSTTEDLSFHTVNGSIAVAVPENASLEVRAETMGGNINSDFPLTIDQTRRGRPKNASGRIGSGGHQLSMETVNGSIALRKRSGTGSIPRAPLSPRPPRVPNRERRE